nr:hypothetical protein [Micromonospora sp. DSM 115978]
CSMGSSRFRVDIPLFVELDKAGRLDVDALIESHITLDTINESYEAMRRKEINGRRVIMFPT